MTILIIGAVCTILLIIALDNQDDDNDMNGGGTLRLKSYA